MNRTIVILHGWGHNKNHWKDFSRNFSDYTIVTFDLPGFGTEPLQGNWGLEEYASWVEQKITNETSGRVILIGHSFGGRIATYLASKNPQWLDSLVLYGVPLFYRPSLRIQFQSRLVHFLQRFIPFKEKLKKSILKENYALNETFKKIVTSDLSDEIPLITARTLQVWGENDVEAPTTNASKAQKIMKNSSLVLLPKCGHNVHLEAPYLFYGVIKKFIETA